MIPLFNYKPSNILRHSFVLSKLIVLYSRFNYTDNVIVILPAVVWCFFSDINIMGMAFSHACIGYFYKSGFLQC